MMSSSPFLSRLAPHLLPTGCLPHPLSGALAKVNSSPVHIFHTALLTPPACPGQFGVTGQCDFPGTFAHLGVPALLSGGHVVA